MYEISRNQIKSMVYQNTPIDTIVTTNEFRNGIEVNGYAKNEMMTYKFYENGQVERV